MKKPWVTCANYWERTLYTKDPTMRQRLERKISFVCLFVYFCHPHFWFYSFRIFPSASAIRRYPVHVLQTPLCTLWFASVCRICSVEVCVINLRCILARLLLAFVPVLCVGIWFAYVWRLFVLLRGDLICVCVPILSCRGLCGQLTFHSRVFMTWPMPCLSPGTLCGDLICVCVTSLFTLWFASMWQI